MTVANIVDAVSFGMEQEKLITPQMMFKILK